MDGNGRWAAARGLPRAEGHRRGVEALRRVVRAAPELGILHLTIFSFSSENWSRPATEMATCSACCAASSATTLRLCRAGVKVKVIGTRAKLDPDIWRCLHEAESDRGEYRSQPCRRVQLRHPPGNRRGRTAHAEVAEGKRNSASINAEAIGGNLDTAEIPDPDLIIRTSGEQRLSNFLMWQAAYSEFVFVPIHWPDFDKAALEGAIEEYAPRAPFRRTGAKTGS